MFFDLVRRNSKRSRRENGIYFVSLIVSIVAFYIILSLENQDVMIFLKEMESDAVSRLLGLIPVLYGMTLFIIFFLVYFAGKYQLDRRNHEFGIYLISGMRKTRLFGMLIAEDILNSVWALAVGIPVAVLLSEVISLVTARLVGLGIVGHRFTFSVGAAGYTILGFFLVKAVAFAILSGRIAKTEIQKLLTDSQEEKPRKVCGKKVAVEMLMGILLLCLAYCLAIRGMAWRNIRNMGITMLIGICGTFLAFYGVSAVVELLFRRKKKESGLNVFTFRQIQEYIAFKPNTLAIASLLILAAVCCFGYGVALSVGSSIHEGHCMDYTFQGDEKEVKDAVGSGEISKYFDELFEVRTGLFFAELDSEHTFSAESFIDTIRQQKNSEDQEILLNNLQYFTSPYLIELSGYNRILELAGKKPIQIEDNQMVLYSDAEFTTDSRDKVVEQALDSQPYVEFDGEKYQITEGYYHEGLVTDRLITISYGLIVTDKTYEKLLEGREDNVYWNATLEKNFVEKEGLMRAIAQVNRLLDEKEVPYESYLQNIGRQLFYVVGSSYLTIYLAIIFLIISNTVLGVQYLMQQQKDGKRYQTLIHLGCDYRMLCRSARSQIRWFFCIPVVGAAISSVFGIKSLFSGILMTSMKSKTTTLFVIALAMLLVLCVVEYMYVAAVMRTSDRHLLEMLEIKRDE